ncbi:lipopolysaccharide biosynthesis protein [Chitinophaga qingshengii]|uniref:Polysaccharide biosynthesis C-terminal domain-containing protein n=1 Tax=Chitinophaga qingshengii TaxID=1569794 RepID=A0ABR7TV68_9BACT|nr:polysaccharide biosynthesis C-terminal domain-containing protein [Chitinophaga qingshengii]MBC9934387.1 polysaccharide biosynthesis C-terminal domain-containing protein [Chitinophaga qingshengii]
MGIIRKQSIYSSIFIYIGFAFGAVNLIMLMPKFLTKEEIGLTRVLIDVSTLLATCASLGAVPVINKFFPFYHEYLKPEKNDLPKLTLIVSLIGYGLFILFTLLFKGLIIRKFSGNSPLFITYFNGIYPLTFFILMFNMLEGFAWGLHKTVASNFLKEGGIRMASTIMLLLLAFAQISVGQYIDWFSLPYAIAAIILLIIIWRTGQLKFNPGGLSNVTRRLGKRMFIFSSYVFSSNVFTLLRKTNDVLIISSLHGLEQAGLFSYAIFVISFMEVPQRSMYAITTPILATAWKNKDLAKIQELYTKSSITLSIAGVGIFGAIWLSVHNLVLYLGPGWELIVQIIFILGLAKMIDLITGINNQIIQTSNYWRFDFVSSIVVVFISIALNYILQKRIGTIGAAYADLITVGLFNLIRFGFIWIRFGMQPLNWKTLWAVLLGIGGVLLVQQLPFMLNMYVDTIVRSILFMGLFGAAVINARLSEDVNNGWEVIKGKIGLRY